MASVCDASSQTAVTHTDGNEIFNIRKCILVPQQIYFIYPHNLWLLGKLGLKQLDLDVFLYSTYSMHGVYFNCFYNPLEIHECLVSAVKSRGKGFQIKEMGKYSVQN